MPEPVTPERNILNKTYSVQEIAAPQLMTRIGFSGADLGRMTPDIRSRIENSRWLSIENERIIIQVNDPAISINQGRLNPDKKGSVQIVDLDDTLTRTTAWHMEEWEQLETRLQIPKTIAREIYDLSKIEVPGKVVREKRYTPDFNLLLLSRYLEIRKQNPNKKPEEILEELKSVKPTSETSQLNQQVLDVFLNNKLGLFKFFKGFFIEGGAENNRKLNILVTRGKIEGLLGQIHKVNSIAEISSLFGLTVYTNDLKDEVLDLLVQFIGAHNLEQSPDFEGISVFDDNKKELTAYKIKAETLRIPFKSIQIANPETKATEKILAQSH